MQEYFFSQRLAGKKRTLGDDLRSCYDCRERQRKQYSIIQSPENKIFYFKYSKKERKKEE